MAAKFSTINKFIVTPRSDAISVAARSIRAIAQFKPELNSSLLPENPPTALGNEPDPEHPLGRKRKISIHPNF
jgi:hypothetical protein